MPYSDVDYKARQERAHASWRARAEIKLTKREPPRSFVYGRLRRAFSFQRESTGPKVRTEAADKVDGNPYYSMLLWPSIHP